MKFNFIGYCLQALMLLLLFFSCCSEIAHVGDSHAGVDLFRSGDNHALCRCAVIQVEETEKCYFGHVVE